MLYDLAAGPPEAGSLLESVFMLLTKRRQEQEFLKTRVMVEAILAPHLKGETKLSESFSNLLDVMFPYLGKQKIAKSEMEKKALEHWIGKGAFKVRPLWMAKDSPKAFRSALKRGAKKVKEKEELRKKGYLKRIK